MDMPPNMIWLHEQFGTVAKRETQKKDNREVNNVCVWMGDDFVEAEVLL